MGRGGTEAGAAAASEARPRKNRVCATNPDLSEAEIRELLASKPLFSAWSVAGELPDGGVYVTRDLPAGVGEIAEEMLAFGSGWLICKDPEQPADA
jgi:hypothetical protein